MATIFQFEPNPTVRKTVIQTRIDQLQQEEDDLRAQIRDLVQNALELKQERDALQITLSRYTDEMAGGSNANSNS